MGRRRAHAPAWDLRRLAEPDTRQALQQRLSSIAPVPWTTDVDTHCHTVIGEVAQALVETCPRQRSAPRKTWVSDAAARTSAFRARLFRSTRAAQEALLALDVADTAAGRGNAHSVLHALWRSWLGVVTTAARLADSLPKTTCPRARARLLAVSADTTERELAWWLGVRWSPLFQQCAFPSLLSCGQFFVSLCVEMHALLGRLLQRLLRRDKGAHQQALADDVGIALSAGRTRVGYQRLHSLRGQQAAGAIKMPQRTCCA